MSEPECPTCYGSGRMGLGTPGNGMDMRCPTCKGHGIGPDPNPIPRLRLFTRKGGGGRG